MAVRELALTPSPIRALVALVEVVGRIVSWIALRSIDGFVGLPRIVGKLHSLAHENTRAKSFM